MKKQYFVGSIIMSALLVVPVLASAATADEIRAQIQSLLTQITSLQQQLSTLTSNTSIPTSANASCPNLYRVLSRGSRGSDVISLQQFLIAQGLLSNDSATGYFGSMTEASVQRWQAQNSIVAYGDANTTGYGVIGARTRAAIAAKCGATPVLPSVGSCEAVTGGSCPQGSSGSYVTENGCTVLKCTPQSSSNPTVSASVSAHSFNQGDSVGINWQVSNETHLLKHVIVTLDLYTADGAFVQKIYDTSGTLAGTAQWNGRVVCPFESWLCSFVAPGTYKVRVTLMHDDTGGAAIATAETGAFDITSATPTSQSSSSVFSASPTLGTAPLTVTFTIKEDKGAPVGEATKSIDFGDGAQGSTFTGGCPEGIGNFKMYTCTVATHTYTKSGTYVARLISTPFSNVDNSHLAQTIGTATITVTE